MSMKSRQLQCLNRLIKFTSCYESILDFMIQDKVIKKSDIDRSNIDHALHIYNLLEAAKEQESIMLIAYEWSLLPKEHIGLNILTNMRNKTFYYDEP
jgi:hypothetical protein